MIWRLIDGWIQESLDVCQSSNLQYSHARNSCDTDIRLGSNMVSKNLECVVNLPLFSCRTGDAVSLIDRQTNDQRERKRNRSGRGENRSILILLGSDIKLSKDIPMLSFEGRFPFG